MLLKIAKPIVGEVALNVTCLHNTMLCKVLEGRRRSTRYGYTSGLLRQYSDRTSRGTAVVLPYFTSPGAYARRAKKMTMVRATAI